MNGAYGREDQSTQKALAARWTIAAEAMEALAGARSLDAVVAVLRAFARRAPRHLTTQQIYHPTRERREPCRIALGQPRPLHRQKRIGHMCIAFARSIHRHGHDERLPFRHQVRAILREFPLQPKIPFQPRLRIPGDHRHEQRTVPNLLPDLRIPLIAPAQLALIKPHFHARRPQCLAQATRRLRVSWDA